jgi:hypothetical protein
MFNDKQIKASYAVSAFTILGDLASVAYILLTIYFAKRLANEEDMNLNKFVSGAHAFSVIF